MSSRKSKVKVTEHVDENFDHVFSPSTEVGTADNGQLERERGMSWFVTGLFLSGELGGPCVITIPISVRALGFYFGLVFLLICTIMSIYTAMLLSRSWLIIQKHWPVYRHHCRDPYAQIGFRSHGKWMKILVDLILNIGMFGATVILLVIGAKNISDAVKHFAGYDLDYCYCAIIATAMMTPFSLLKSPQDFWWTMVIGIFCTIVAVIVGMGGVAADMATCEDTFTIPEFNYIAAFASLGNIFLAYGGHSCFPTIQHDMKQPYKFTYSAIMAYIIITFLYLPISVIANLAYNDNLAPSVINNIQVPWIQQTVNILITVNCLFTVILAINPVMQTVENLLNAPHHFGVHRILIRTGMMLLLLFMAETFPEFGPLMGIAGGIVFATTSYLFPVVFYLNLNVVDKKLREGEVKKTDEDPSEKSPKTSTSDVEVVVKVGFVESLKKTELVHLVLMGITFVISFIIMIAATGFALQEMATTSFKMPCYLRWLEDVEDGHNATKITSVYCCGQYSNTSLDDQCISRFD